MRSTSLRIAVLVASGLAVAACAGGVAGLAPLLLAGLALAWPLAASSVARAGARMPCEGTETRTCHDGRVVTHCCPPQAKCNYAGRHRFYDCGDGRCLEDSSDPGRCPAPTGQFQEAADAADCKAKYGVWEEACVDHRVAKACVMQPPTNYDGPPPNPSFRRCGEDRCTTHRFVEDCYPTRAELGAADCEGSWTKVCLGGKVEERCLPGGWQKLMMAMPATKYATCPDGTCAVGDAAACKP